MWWTEGVVGSSVRCRGDGPVAAGVVRAWAFCAVETVGSACRLFEKQGGAIATRCSLRGPQSMHTVRALVCNTQYVCSLMFVVQG